MKPTTTSLSIFLGIFAATVAAQTTDAALPEASPAVTVEPLTADDGSAVVDQFPVPIEMAKRDQQSYRERLVTSLTKRHYGTFT